MKNHELKLDVKYFDDVKSGQKNFEIRKNDRDYQSENNLKLKAFKNGHHVYWNKNKKKWVHTKARKAETIRTKIKYILSADEINEGIDFMGGDDTAHATVNGQILVLPEVETVLKDYFHKDRLPDDYVILGIEVVK